MELTSKEKNILTIMDEVPQKEFIKFAQRFVNYSEEEIKEIADKLIRMRFIEILNVSSDKKQKRNWYFHTNKVTSDMINDDIRYKKDYP